MFKTHSILSQTQTLWIIWADFQHKSSSFAQLITLRITTMAPTPTLLEKGEQPKAINYGEYLKRLQKTFVLGKSALDVIKFEGHSALDVIKLERHSHSPSEEAPSASSCTPTSQVASSIHTVSCFQKRNLIIEHVIDFWRLNFKSTSTTLV